MAAETARQFEALEAQAQKLMGVFVAAGHEAVAPAMIQPAGVFLDVIGEALRARTYVFSDPDGAELCLRPDLTVPTCRLHLERHPDGATPARYCYNGATFRFQPEGAGPAHPREFRQAGIETFGAADRETADAETVTLVIAALRETGIRDFTLRIGDLGLFRAVLAGAPMPQRWWRRLHQLFWRPEAFRAELKRLAASPAGLVQGLPEDLVAGLAARRPGEAEAIVAQYLEKQGIEIIGVRSLGEITERLLSIVSDAAAKPLSPTTASLIEGYLAVAGPAPEAAQRLAELLPSSGHAEAPAALDVFNRRLKLMAERGIDIDRVEFSAEFGRSLAYYTGFVFEIAVPGLSEASPVAGGGRYDSLLRAVGAPRDVPAVGAAIHTERLLAAVNGSAP